MPCELLICAFEKGPWHKGYAVAIKDTPCEWGTKEAPPNWVVLRITDATKDQVENYLKNWPGGMFEFTIQAENAQGYRIRIDVDPAFVNAIGLGGAIKAELREYVTVQYGANLVEYDWNYAVFDIPKPIDLIAARADLRETFNELIDLRRYHFSSADVDLALANGGLIELTKAQVLARVIDKLA